MEMDDPNTDQNSPSASSSSKGKECEAFGCSNTFYGPNRSRTPYHFFKFPEDMNMSGRKRWCNLIKRQHGKDAFFVTNSTVICSDHFKTEDIKKTLTGRWDLLNERFVFLIVPCNCGLL